MVSAVIKENKNIIVNIVGAFLIKGGAMLLSLFMLPAYIKFFGNRNILGVWYTILSIINWVLVFDLGIGNGLRNKLPKSLANKDYLEAKKLVSSTYCSSLCVVTILGIIGVLIIQSLNWSEVLNIEENELPLLTLKSAILIAYVGILIQFVLKIITSVLYAIQKSSIVNLLTFISSAIIFVSISLLPSDSVETSIVTISYINIFAVNIPLLIESIYLFCGSLKEIRPSFSYWTVNSTKAVLKIGITLLWLQLIFMIISSTNEFLISVFCNPADVVVYQVYFKIFNGVASLCTLVLVPIWSAVTKAQVEKKYNWIKNVYKVLLAFCFMTILLDLGVVTFLQQIVNLWLKEDAIIINYKFAVVVAFYSFIFLVHNVNTSVSNGMSFFKPQVFFMTIAAFIDIPLAWLFVRITGGWIGIVLANIIVLLPYEIVEPILFNRHINNMIIKEKNNIVLI